MRESLLQYIWQHLILDTRSLTTGCGKSVSIEFQGELNIGDGPDFRRARIRIDDVWFYGDVELHIDSKDWYTHRHHEDSGYNSVILHVVADFSAAPVQRRDQTYVPTLNIKPALSESASRVIFRSQNEHRLPCEAQITYLNPDVIAEQFEQARRDYFDYRVNQLMEFYDRDLPPYQSWQKLMALALCDGLGYSQNRVPMVEFGRRLLQTTSENAEFRNNLSEAELNDLADLNTHSSDKIRWNFSSARPANHPQKRIQQAYQLIRNLFNLARNDFLNRSLTDIWTGIVHACPNPPGQQREKQLFQSVWLPGIYLMGTLCASQKLKDASYQLWQHQKGGVPESILKTFTGCGTIPKKLINHPGATYQFKYMCRSHKCSNCGIMKNLINS